MTAALALISGLPREELQNLTKEISTLMASSPKEKVKRVAAVGQKAWFAFMRHCRDTMADRFTAGLKAPEIAVICKAIREEDEAVYTAFVEKFKEENPAPSAPVAAAPSVPAAPAAPAPVAKAVSKPVAKASAKLTAEEKALEKEQKAAAKSAEKEAKSAEKQQKAATKSAEKAAEKEAARLAKEGARLAKEAEKEAAKQQKAAAKEAAKQAKLAAKPAKPTKAKAKATAPISAEATPAPAEPEEDVMPKITIAGVTYFHDESSNGLYGIDAATNGLSHWVGFFQPDNEAEPIRYTASEGDDE
jgi:hypothetical protein